MANWDQVEYIAGGKNLLIDLFKRLRRGKSALKNSRRNSAPKLIDAYNKNLIISNEDFIKEQRRRFLTTLKGLYWHKFESGQCAGYSAILLIGSANECLDEDYSPITDWERLYPSIHSQRFIKSLIVATRIPCIGSIFQRMLNTRVLTAYDVAKTFIDAHEEAVELSEQLGSIDPQVFKIIFSETEKQMEQCNEFIEKYLSDHYADAMSLVHTINASHFLLNAQRQQIIETFHNGLIEENEMHRLIDSVDKNIKRLKLREDKEPLSLRKLMKIRFPDLPALELEVLLLQFVEKNYNPNQPVILEDEGALLIMRGRVKEIYEDAEVILSPGDVAGSAFLLDDYGVQMEAVTATYVQGFFIPKSCMRLSRAFQSQLMTQIAVSVFVNERVNFSEELVKLSVNTIRTIVSKSTIIDCYKGQQMDIQHGGVIISGVCGTIFGPAFIKPENITKVAMTECIFMEFSADIANLLREYHDNYLEAFTLAASEERVRTGQSRWRNLKDMVDVMTNSYVSHVINTNPNEESTLTERIHVKGRRGGVS